jgi:predicted PurR-regulated permease PerM
VEETSGSPAWTNTAKLAVGLAMIAILALLVWRFRNIVSFLLLAVLLAYLLYPLTTRLRSLGLTWRGASMVVFLLTIIIVFGSLVWGGYALVTQSQSLISFIQGILRTGVPDLLLRLPSFDIGTFHFPPANLNDLGDIGNDLLGLVNPILSRTTSLLTGIASGTATFIGWTFFTLLVTYFIMAESSGIPSQMINFNIPGYSSDIRKFTRYLSGIWNAFLRGQLIIILITVLAYFILLSILGVRFALGLAIIAGMARFVPYVGPAVAWTSYGLVAFFQGSTILGLSPGWYVFLVVVTAWVTDLIMDNLVAARLMGNALKIHPAAIMVSALVAANLLGVVGVVLAAPVAATLKLMFEYLMNKLLDRDPWEGVKTSPPPVSRSLLAQLRYHLARLRALWQNLRRKQKTA